MAVLARLNHRPTRPANAVGDIAIVESHAFLRNAIEVRRFIDFAAVARQRLVRVIVGEDEQDVWFLSRLRQR